MKIEIDDNDCLFEKWKKEDYNKDNEGLEYEEWCLKHYPKIVQTEPPFTLKQFAKNVLICLAAFLAFPISAIVSCSSEKHKNEDKPVQHINYIKSTDIIIEDVNLSIDGTKVNIKCKIK